MARPGPSSVTTAWFSTSRPRIASSTKAITRASTRSCPSSTEAASAGVQACYANNGGIELDNASDTLRKLWESVSDPAKCKYWTNEGQQVATCYELMRPQLAPRHPLGETWCEEMQIRRSAVSPHVPGFGDVSKQLISSLAKFRVTTYRTEQMRSLQESALAFLRTAGVAFPGRQRRRIANMIAFVTFWVSESLVRAPDSNPSGLLHRI